MDYSQVLYAMLRDKGIGSNEMDVTFRRKDLFDCLVKIHNYSARTADNLLAEGRPSGMVNYLLEAGLIYKGGIKQWIVKSMQSLEADRHQKKKPRSPRYFYGAIPKFEDGWMIDPTFQFKSPNCEWQLYFKEYKPTCYNLRLVAIPGLHHKANFYMANNNGRLSVGKDERILFTQHPDVYKTLVAMLPQPE